MLVTNQAPTDLPAEFVAALYRQRWRVELFFRWMKCILGCRHWLAESSRGVAIEIYLALVAALLLQTLQRPPSEPSYARTYLALPPRGGHQPRSSSRVGTPTPEPPESQKRKSLTAAPASLSFKVAEHSHAPMMASLPSQLDAFAVSQPSTLPKSRKDPPALSLPNTMARACAPQTLTHAALRRLQRPFLFASVRRRSCSRCLT